MHTYIHIIHIYILVQQGCRCPEPRWRLAARERYWRKAPGEPAALPLPAPKDTLEFSDNEASPLPIEAFAFVLLPVSFSALRHDVNDRHDAVPGPCRHCIEWQKMIVQTACTKLSLATCYMLQWLESQEEDMYSSNKASAARSSCSATMKPWRDLSSRRRHKKGSLCQNGASLFRQAQLRTREALEFEIMLAERCLGLL